MKCHECNSEMTEAEELYHYTESGLDNVFIEGIHVARCQCGEFVASIPSLIELNTSIGLSLVKKETLLKGNEIKYLRKNSGLKAKDMARYVGVDKSTFSRWENDRQAIDKSHDRLIRLVYVTMKRIPPDDVKHLIEDDFTRIKPEATHAPRHVVSKRMLAAFGK